MASSIFFLPLIFFSIFIVLFLRLLSHIFPHKFIHDRINKHSPEIFKTSTAGENVVVFCGPKANKFIFSNDNLFKTWWPPSVSQALLFATNNPDLERDHSFLKLDSMRNYVPIMDSMAKEHVQTNWVGFDEVNVHTLAKEFTFALACRIFINCPNPIRVRELMVPFFAVAGGITSVPVSFPATPFRDAAEEGKVIREKLVEIVKQRRMDIAENRGFNGDSNDLLSRLVVSLGEDGKFFTEEEIANKIMWYLIASFYTTSSTITSVLNHLAEFPHVYDKVLQEQMVIEESKGAGEMLTWGDVQKMKYTWNVVCESMRLAPSAQGGFKEVLRDFTFAGFKIPKGWKVFWTVNSTNKNPEYFPEPEKLDPSRFEGHGPPPFTFVPFGGGPGMCAGKEYARIEILTFVHNVVTRFRLKKANPTEGLKIRLESNLMGED